MDTLANFFEKLESQSLQVPNNIIEILKFDHRKVDLLFNQYDKSESIAEKQLLLDIIIKELAIHANVEEKLVYPKIEDEDHEGVGEAIEEHHLVKLLLAELADMSPFNEQTDSKVKVLSELVRHHVVEEECELLPILEESGIDLEILGKQVMAAKAMLLPGIKKVGDKTGTEVGGSPRKKKPTEERRAS